MSQNVYKHLDSCPRMSTNTWTHVPECLNTWTHGHKLAAFIILPLHGFNYHQLAPVVDIANVFTLHMQWLCLYNSWKLDCAPNSNSLFPVAFAVI